ncbi:MAG: autotransporter domain-containing protein, partial [Croceibacterium sp.]
MRRYLLASTAVLAFAAPAAATDITTAKTTPLQTSTVKNGVPDSITITSTGSVTVTAGTAVTMDDNHSVANQGKIAINNANDATGIAAAAGTTGDISNTGTITVDETYTPTDTDKDGDLDGPFALGSNRFGIRTLGDHTGDVVNNGTITVEGNDSAGIWLGGKLTGALTHNGTTTVLGDRAIGLQAQDITGNVRLAGTVSATGKDAIAARFSGDIGGALVVQGNITSTGYRYTAPTDTSKLDADDLLQGGSALIVEGNVAGGIILAVPPKDNSPTNNDEDADGIEDSKEGSANVN